MPDNDAPEIPMAGGLVSSSAGPMFHLIPTEALVRYAERSEVGLKRKGDKAWNAATQNNQSCLTDMDFVLARIDHVIAHALKLRDKLIKKEPMGDDDAAAIIWAGGFLCCATAKLMSQTPPLNCSACGGMGTVTQKFGRGSGEDIITTTCPACKGTGKSKL